MFNIRIFGPLRADFNGQPAADAIAPRTRQLWAYLLLNRKAALTRAQVAFALWPDAPERRALANLRQHLHRLRRALPSSDPESAWIVADQGTLRWNPEAAATLDLETLVNVVARMRLETPPPPEEIAEALALSESDLLATMWDDWVITARGQVQRQREEIAHWLTLYYLDQGDITEAVGIAEDLVVRDPWGERWQRLLMGVQALGGEHAAALRGFREFELSLAAELGASASSESLSLAGAISAGIPGAKVRRLLDADVPRLTDDRSCIPTDGIAEPLPTFEGGFFGRSRELQEISSRLEQPGLLTLFGPGGCGKTRLATEFVQCNAASFPAGITFITVVGLEAPAHALERAARALADTSGNGGDATVGAALLVMDACESRPSVSVALANGLLSPGTNLRILATSRTVLGVQAEQVCPVPPLPIPDLRMSSDQVTSSEPAIALFEERARRRQPSFRVGPDSLPSIGRICRAVGGLPLGIELAACSISALAPSQIAERIERGLELPASTRQIDPMASRSPSLNQTLRRTYNSILETERSFFNGLSVFPGSWTLEAAEALGLVDDLDSAGDQPALMLIAQLVDQSLVMTAPTSTQQRYRILPPLRRIGEKELVDKEYAELRYRHADFYVAFAEHALPYLTGPNQSQWLDRLEADNDNFTAALSWLIDTDQQEPAVALTGCLWRYWYMRGRAAEGSEWLEHVVGSSETETASDATFLEASEGSSVAGAALARALHGAGALRLTTNDYVAAAVHHRRELLVARRLNDSRLLADAELGLGVVCQHQQDYPRAHSHYLASLKHWRQSEDTRGQAITLSNLGSLARDAGNWDEARQHLNACLALNRECRDYSGYANALWGLADLLYCQDESEAAAGYYYEMRNMFQKLGQKRGEAFALQGLGRISLRDGKFTAASEQLVQGLQLISTVGDRLGTAQMLEDFVMLEHRRGDKRRMVAIGAAASKIRQELGRPPSATIDRVMSPARHRLGTRESTRVSIRGLELNSDDILTWYTGPEQAFEDWFLGGVPRIPRAH